MRAQHLQRKADANAAGEQRRQDAPARDDVQRKALMGLSYDDAVQRLAPGGQTGEDTGAVHAAAARGTSGGGGRLPHLDAIQRSFGGHDVSGVAAHVGGRATEACDAMGANAYASGGAVAFKGAPDLHTAAHEAAHVVQQKAGVSLKGGVGQVGDSYESHADKVADAVVQGKSAEGLLDQMAGGGKSSAGVQKKAAVQRKNDLAPGLQGKLNQLKVALNTFVANNGGKGLAAGVESEAVVFLKAHPTAADAFVDLAATFLTDKQVIAAENGKKVMVLYQLKNLIKSLNEDFGSQRGSGTCTVQVAKAIIKKHNMRGLLSHMKQVLVQNREATYSTAENLDDMAVAEMGGTTLDRANHGVMSAGTQFFAGMTPSQLMSALGRGANLKAEASSSFGGAKLTSTLAKTLEAMVATGKLVCLTVLTAGGAKHKMMIFRSKAGYRCWNASMSSPDALNVGSLTGANYGEKYTAALDYQVFPAKANAWRGASV